MVAVNATLPYNPVDIANKFVILPIYYIGFIVNGVIIVALGTKRRSIQFSDIEHVAATLVVVSFFCSVFNALKYCLLFGGVKSDFMLRLEGFISSLFLLLYFGLNTTFSVERYLAVKHWTSLRIRRAICVLWTIYALFITIVGWTFAKTDMVDLSLTPDLDYLKTYMLTMAAAFVITFILALYLNAMTYIISKRKISDLLNECVKVTGDTTSSFRERLALANINRKLVIRSILMNVNLFVCHTPVIVLSVVGNLIPPLIGATCGAIGYTFMASEVIVTPVMVLYFFPKFRHLFDMEAPVTQDGAAATPDLSSFDNENSEVTLGSGQGIDATQPSRFHVIRIVN